MKKTEWHLRQIWWHDLVRNADMLHITKQPPLSITMMALWLPRFILHSMHHGKNERKCQVSGNCLLTRLGKQPFRKCWAPSRHSGDSSLSPNEPRSSLTIMSADSGADHCRMSEDTTVTNSPQNSAFMFCKLYTHTHACTHTHDWLIDWLRKA